MHGGVFVSRHRSEQTACALGSALTNRGYVVASIGCRVDISDTTSLTFVLESKTPKLSFFLPQQLEVKK